MKVKEVFRKTFGRINNDMDKPRENSIGPEEVELLEISTFAFSPRSAQLKLSDSDNEGGRSQKQPADPFVVPNEAQIYNSPSEWVRRNGKYQPDNSRSPDDDFNLHHLHEDPEHYHHPLSRLLSLTDSQRQRRRGNCTASIRCWLIAAMM